MPSDKGSEAAAALPTAREALNAFNNLLEVLRLLRLNPNDAELATAADVCEKKVRAALTAAAEMKEEK